MSNAEVADMLKNMSSASISQVEIMTNPPAKYDAAGNAGVINIKLKKGSNTGFNGSVNASFGQGIYAKGNGGINLNYRQKAYNVFGTYNYSQRKNMQELDLSRSFFAAGTGNLSHSMLQNADMKMPSHNNRFKAGIDLFLNPKSTLGFMVNGSIGTWESLNPTYSQKVNPAHQSEGSSYSQNHITEDWNNFTYNVNYKLTLDTSGRELTADVDYAQNKYGSNQLYNTTFYNSQGQQDPGNPQLIQKGVIPSTATIVTAKVDYTHPFGKN